MPDLLVVGGGPAGLATALYAARAGLDVAVLERQQLSIDKACGEGLMPAAVRALRELGVDPAGHHLSGITYQQGRHTAVGRFTSGAGRGVRRTTLHAELLAAVARAGIPVQEATVRRVEQNADTVWVDGRRARWVVAADGLHSGVRATLDGVRPAGVRRWGQRRHYAIAPWTDQVEVSWAGEGEVYVTPVTPATIGVAVLSTARGSLDAHLQNFPTLSERLQGATVLSSDRGSGPLRQNVRRRVLGRVLLVGDAAGYVDALTGEGIAVALASARVLVECLAAGRPDRYEREWLRVTRRYRVITSTLLWARQRPMLSRAVVPTAARVPRLFAAAVNLLAG